MEQIIVNIEFNCVSLSSVFSSIIEKVDIMIYRLQTCFVEKNGDIFTLHPVRNSVSILMFVFQRISVRVFKHIQYTCMRYRPNVISNTFPFTCSISGCGIFRWQTSI